MSTWKIEGKKLIVTDKTTNIINRYNLPPKKTTRKGRTIITLVGESSKGTERILLRR